MTSDFTYAVFNCVRNNGPIRLSQLASYLETDFTEVHTHIQELIKANRIKRQIKKDHMTYYYV